MRVLRAMLIATAAIVVIASTAYAGTKHDHKVLASTAYDSSATALVSKTDIHVCRNVCLKTGRCRD